MLDKPNDIIHECKIKELPKIDPEAAKLFFHYVLERHNVQMKKDSGLPAPWTDDPIIQTYSFTCNRRQDDRTSKWLINNISNNPDLPLNERVWRSMLFRMYNRISTAESLQLNKNPDSFWNNAEKFGDIIDQLPEVYTRAYRTLGSRYRFKDRYPDRDWRSLRLLGTRDLYYEYDGKIPDDLMKTAYDGYRWIKRNICGCGYFQSMQLLIDLMYINEIPYSNNHFVIAGPGARIGLEILMPGDLLDWEECIFYIADHFEELCREYYDPKFDYSKIKEDLHDDKAYCVTDVQNHFCEYGKYYNYLTNHYHKRRKYVPYVEDKSNG